MELNDIITLAAASLLSGKVHVSYDGKSGMLPNPHEITEAVRVAKQIWEEVLKQDNN